MRSLLALLLFAACAQAAPPTITLPPEAKAKPGRMVLLTAVTDGKSVEWFCGSDDVDLFPIPGTRTALFSSLVDDVYQVAAWTAADGIPSKPAICRVVVGGGRKAPPAPVPPVPPAPVPPVPKADPPAALCRLRVGNSGCTATVVHPRRRDGKWDVLTAAHCTGGVGSRGQITLKDGRVLPVSVSVRGTGPDICWLLTDDASLSDLPFAVLAAGDPPGGVAVWHAGYGVDKPGNREDGTATSGPDGKGQMQYRLSVSSGDSGGGIFRSDTGELLSPVCCTSRLAGPGQMWGGAPSVARRLRPAVAADEVAPNTEDDQPQPGVARPIYQYPDLEELVPVPMPIRADAADLVEAARPEHICADLAEAWRRGVTEKRSVIVWVGSVCGPCVRGTKEYLHVRVDRYDGGRGQGVIILVSKDGDLVQATDKLLGFPSADVIRHYAGGGK